jgi:kynureninase
MTEPIAPMARGTETDGLLCWRPEFPTLETKLHFISHSLGAMPRGAEEALAGYVEAWKTESIRAWEKRWMSLPVDLGNVIGRVIGAEPDTLSMHENVTTAQAIALSAVDFAPPRNRVVCTEQDFPSVLYLYEGLARRGAEVTRVRSRERLRIREEDVVAAIDERTAVVAISSVLFRSAQVLDLEPIVARAHDVGALTLIDAYQAVGAVPVDVQSSRIDLMTGGSIKWMCGGPGASWLYVAPRVRARLEPAITGWFGHADPFAFDTGPLRRDAGARRFWTGTPGIPGFAAARPGCEIVAEIGVAAIRAKSLRQTSRVIGWADEFGLPLVTPRDETRGGSVVLDVPNAGRVCQALLDSGVLLDFRPGVGLRLAPHFYTSDDEVDEVMRRIQGEVQRTG